MRAFVLSFVLIACDSPGGGKESPCATDPSLTICQRDTSEPDTTTPSDTSVATTDIALPDIDGPIECVDELTRCDGANLVEQCIDGHWVATTQCNGTTLCVNGACVEQECISGERCVDGGAQRCVDNHWQELERCEFGCDGDACATHGDESCAAIYIGCARETDCDLAPDAPCTKACARRGSSAAQATFDALVTCSDHPSWSELVNDCVPIMAECLAPVPGTGTCDDLYSCTFRCEQDYECFETCYAAATRDAALSFLRYVQCDGCVSGDCLAACSDYFERCP